MCRVLEHYEQCYHDGDHPEKCGDDEADMVERDLSEEGIFHNCRTVSIITSHARLGCAYYQLPRGL